MNVDDAPQPLPLMMQSGPGEAERLSESTSEELRLSLEALAATNEHLLIDGPSLVTTHGAPSPLSVQIGELVDGKVLLLVHFAPGLSAEGVVKLCEPFGHSLLGVLINSVTRYREREVQRVLGPALESRGVRFLGAIPDDRTMLSVTVGQIAHHLDGRWVLGQENQDGLVGNFLIGANIMDRATIYFGRLEDQGVIVRGDRPDIQLAALSLPTRCLVLTNGYDPIQYVYYQAEQEEVPVLVVQTDTVTTAHALDSVLQSSTFHHPRKLDRFQELLREYADVRAIEAVL